MVLGYIYIVLFVYNLIRLYKNASQLRCLTSFLYFFV